MHCRTHAARVKVSTPDTRASSLDTYASFPARVVFADMKYLTTTQIASLLRVSSRRVRQIAESRNIEGVRFGGALAFDCADLAKFTRRPTGRPRKSRKGVSK